MGQTSGGNSGGLELLERVSATEEQIEGILTRVSGEWITAPGIVSFNLIKTYNIITLVQMSTSIDFEFDNLQEITIGSTKVKVLARIDNSDYFNLVSPTRIWIGALPIFWNNGTNSSIININIVYDGTNTYLGTTASSIVPKSFASGTLTAPVNTQPK